MRISDQRLKARRDLHTKLTTQGWSATDAAYFIEDLEDLIGVVAWESTRGGDGGELPEVSNEWWL